MKKPGEQPATQAQDDTDPRQKTPKRGIARAIGASVTATALALSAGATVRASQESHEVHGNAQVSAEAAKDPLIYFKSNERNALISDEVTRYSDKIIRDMNNHPERTQYLENGPTEDNNDNVNGEGAFVETIKSDGDTYTFTLLASQHGAVIKSDDVVMTRTSTTENGVVVSTGVTFTQQGSENIWSTQISQSHDKHFDGPLAAVNLSVAEHPDQTGQRLQENDNRALMVAEQYLEAAKITE